MTGFIIAQTDSEKDHRIQYPPGLLHSNFGVSIGYINYPFSNNTFEQGFSAESVQVPHVAVRVNLYGHQFNKWLSANIHYMRPVKWVRYKNINGDKQDHTVWMNIVGLTLQSHLPVYKRLSVYGEAGLAIVTRKGFKINNNWAIKNANYATFFLETGFRYQVNQKWDMTTAIGYSPSHAAAKQPSTSFYSAGFTYKMEPLPEKRLENVRKSGYTFPKNIFQVGFASNALGYGVNKFAYKGPIPFFWGGSAEVKNGIAVHYQRNIFHTRRIFSFDWGISIASWNSRINHDKFFTLSTFPVLRFTLLHSAPADYYFYYSVAGPSYISKKIIDRQNTGKHFTFQDLLGVGAFVGKQRKFNAEIKIGHYSNGNIFPDNAGVKIPLTFAFGYSF